jgi:hypothetical protein
MSPVPGRSIHPSPRPSSRECPLPLPGPAAPRTNNKQPLSFSHPPLRERSVVSEHLHHVARVAVLHSPCPQPVLAGLRFCHQLPALPQQRSAACLQQKPRDRHCHAAGARTSAQIGQNHGREGKVRHSGACKTRQTRQTAPLAARVHAPQKYGIVNARSPAADPNSVHSCP